MRGVPSNSMHRAAAPVKSRRWELARQRLSAILRAIRNDLLVLRADPEGRSQVQQGLLRELVVTTEGSGRDKAYRVQAYWRCWRERADLGDLRDAGAVEMGRPTHAPLARLNLR